MKQQVETAAGRVTALDTINRVGLSTMSATTVAVAVVFYVRGGIWWALTGWPVWVVVWPLTYITWRNPTQTFERAHNTKNNTPNPHRTSCRVK